MTKLFNWVTLAGGVVGGAFSYCLGGWDALAKVLIIFMVMDYISGLLSAGFAGTLCSSKGFKGIIKKTAILLTVCFASMMQQFLNVPVRDIVMTFFIVNEGLSIVENIGKIIELPDIIKKSLIALRGEKSDG